MDFHVLPKTGGSDVRFDSEPYTSYVLGNNWKKGPLKDPNVRTNDLGTKRSGYFV